MNRITPADMQTTKSALARRHYYNYIIVDFDAMSSDIQENLVSLCRSHKCILYKFENKCLIYRFVYGTKHYILSYDGKRYKSTVKDYISEIIRMINIWSGKKVKSLSRVKDGLNIHSKLVEVISNENIVAFGFTTISTPTELMVAHADSENTKWTTIVSAQHVWTRIKSDRYIEKVVNKTVENLIPSLVTTPEDYVIEAFRDNLTLILKEENDRIRRSHLSLNMKGKNE